MLKKKKPLYGRVLTYEEVLKYGPKYERMHKLWRAYNYDSLIAQNTLYHKQGYISEDMYGICTRTIKKCNEIMDRIERVIDKREERYE